jgi:hypothetical protein
VHLLRSFILGTEGKAVLKRYGFDLPKGGKDWISQR